MAITIDYATTAKCEPGQIWSVLEDVSRWPRFDPQKIRDARWVLGMPWQPGSKFQIRIAKPLPATLTPEVLEVDPPIMLRLHAQGGGVHGEVWFVFKQLFDGAGTEMRTLQEFTGKPLAFLGDRVKRGVEQGMAHVFGMIKAEAEAHAARSNGGTQATSGEPSPGLS